MVCKSKRKPCHQTNDSTRKSPIQECFWSSCDLLDHSINGGYVSALLDWTYCAAKMPYCFHNKTHMMAISFAYVQHTKFGGLSNGNPTCRTMKHLPSSSVFNNTLQKKLQSLCRLHIECFIIMQHICKGGTTLDVQWLLFTNWGKFHCWSSEHFKTLRKSTLSTIFCSFHQDLLSMYTPFLATRMELLPS